MTGINIPAPNAGHAGHGFAKGRPMYRILDKVCVVTGGAGEIGRACAVRMGREGARIALFDLHDDIGQAHALALREAGIDAHYWHVDVGSEPAVVHALAQVVGLFGALHVLVNNANLTEATDAHVRSADGEWDRLQVLNVARAGHCTGVVTPYMRRTGGGSVVNLLPTRHGPTAAPHPSAGPSGGALQSMSQADALRYGADRIRVNMIRPGHIWTAAWRARLASEGADVDAVRATLAAAHPLGTLGEPDDVAWGVVFLASDEARLVTGCELVIDGGRGAC